MRLLAQSECYELEGIDGDMVDEAHEFVRLKQSMEMVGFSSETQRRIFSVLTAVLHLGNVQYKKVTQTGVALSDNTPPLVAGVSQGRLVKR